MARAMILIEVGRLLETKSLNFNSQSRRWLSNDMLFLRKKSSHRISSKVPALLNHLDASRSLIQQNVRSCSTTYGSSPSWKSVDELGDSLLDNVLADNDDFVAINKPSGLGLHSYWDGGVHDDQLSIDDALPYLMQKLKSKQLAAVVGINKKYSGVILLAKHEESCKKLRKFYASSVPAQRILPYTFWGLTVRVPTPLNGSHSFIVTRKEVGCHKLTFIADQISKRGRQKGEFIHPYISYETLDRSNSSNCALVELKPTQSKWDILPVYIVTKLATFLGDHTYSSRLATILGKPVLIDQYKAIPETQRLSKLILQSLKISKEDVENLPIHLHHKRLLVPQLSKNCESVEIEAPLPEFFNESMRRLGFNSNALDNVRKEEENIKPLEAGSVLGSGESTNVGAGDKNIASNAGR